MIFYSFKGDKTCSCRKFPYAPLSPPSPSLSLSHYFSLLPLLSLSLSHIRTLGEEWLPLGRHKRTAINGKPTRYNHTNYMVLCSSSCRINMGTTVKWYRYSINRRRNTRSLIGYIVQYYREPFGTPLILIGFISCVRPVNDWRPSIVWHGLQTKESETNLEDSNINHNLCVR